MLCITVSTWGFVVYYYSAPKRWSWFGCRRQPCDILVLAGGRGFCRAFNDLRRLPGLDEMMNIRDALNDINRAFVWWIWISLWHAVVRRRPLIGPL